MATKQNKQHGGARPGAGRKAKDVEPGRTKVLTAILNPLLEMIKALNVNRTEFINEAIMEKLVRESKYKGDR